MEQHPNLKEIDCTHYDPSTYSHESEKVLINYPVQCPHCRNVGDQGHVISVLTDSDEEPGRDLADLIVITRCPYCKNHTVHFMNLVTPPTFHYLYDNGDFYDSYTTIPRINNFERTLSDNILKDYPRFAEVFNQSIRAEDEGLNELAGMGYRKALEILLTDFLISKHTEKKDKLESFKTTLSDKIKILDDKYSNLKTLATASAWIGNDETHYTRRHPDQGINDLKLYINSFISEINNDITLKNAKSLIGKNNPTTPENH